MIVILADDVEFMRNQLKILNVERTRDKEAILDLEDEVLKLRKENEHRKGMQEALQRKLEENREAIDCYFVLKEENQQIVKLLKTSRFELNSIADSKAKTESAHKSLWSTYEEVKNELDDALKVCESLEDREKSLEKALEILNQDFEILKREKKVIEKELAVRNAELQKIKSELEYERSKRVVKEEECLHLASEIRKGSMDDNISVYSRHTLSSQIWVTPKRAKLKPALSLPDLPDACEDLSISLSNSSEECGRKSLPVGCSAMNLESEIFQYVRNTVQRNECVNGLPKMPAQSFVSLPSDCVLLGGSVLESSATDVEDFEKAETMSRYTTLVFHWLKFLTDTILKQAAVVARDGIDESELRCAHLKTVEEPDEVRRRSEPISLSLLIISHSLEKELTKLHAELHFGLTLPNSREKRLSSASAGLWDSEIDSVPVNVSDSSEDLVTSFSHLSLSEWHHRVRRSLLVLSLAEQRIEEIMTMRGDEESSCANRKRARSSKTEAWEKLRDVKIR
ncbi:unnamed protein product [Notodromas monacha]|uniref:Uncharacterized protein n=1 Tax=Notodromas monacha TaxID=399045 RepID=A0A7R9BIY0_9CRUS|nr:unnamed protein product [Notodromas monacha]CAG0915258.1 unnamed protein product [Notodromas monacha]